MARKRLLTVEGAILLHLLEYSKYAPEDTLPLGMTQAGISLTLGVRRSHVAQSLDVAIGQGKVEEHLSRVKGEKRKRKCYFLTPPGLGKAREINEAVLNTEVRSELAGGQEFHGTMFDLVALLGGRFRVPNLALLVTEGRLMLPDADRNGGGRAGTIPAVGRFHGRTPELQSIRNHVLGNTRILGVTGMPGIGKTSLVARALEGTDNVFWYRVSDWGSPRHAAGHLAAFLNHKGSGRLGRYMEAHETLDLGDIHDIIAAESIRAVMVFDDCHKAGINMRAFLGMLARACSVAGELKLCMIGRGLPDTDGLLIGPLNESTAVITIGPLDNESSLAILRDRGISGARAKAIADRGAGHPLYLNIADEAGSGDVAQMLSKEIQATLSESENRIMLQMSVYRQPVATEGLAEAETDISALDNLASRSLAVNAGGWSMHSLLRDFFYSRQPPAQRETRHECAAEFYALYDSSTGGQVEEMYHLFMARDFESAIMRLGERGRDILTRGYTDEILVLCDMVPEDWQNPDEVLRTDFIKATALDISGSWDRASAIYLSCADRAREDGDTEDEAGALRRLAAIEYRKGNLAGAGQMLETALRKLKSGTMMAEVLGSLGVVQWKTGDAAAAAESYARDLEISESEKDLRGISRALNNLGILDWEAGNNALVLEKYSRALSCAEKIKDSRLVAILYSNLGDVHRTMGNPGDAKRYYERCLALAEDLRFHWQIAEAYRGLAEVVPDKKRDYLSRALAIFERLGAAGDAKIVRGMIASSLP
jgi:tetratricopeptide (TPR) repeat protein